MDFKPTVLPVDSPEDFNQRTILARLAQIQEEVERNYFTTRVVKSATVHL